MTTQERAALVALVEQWREIAAGYRRLHQPPMSTVVASAIYECANDLEYDLADFTVPSGGAEGPTREAALREALDAIQSPLAIDGENHMAAVYCARHILALYAEPAKEDK